MFLSAVPKLFKGQQETPRRRCRYYHHSQVKRRRQWIMTRVALKWDHPFLFYKKEHGGKIQPKAATKSSTPLSADFMNYYLQQSFAGPQPSAKDLLSWNQSTNYIVTGGFKILVRKCNKINKNQLGKFCLTTFFFFPSPSTLPCGEMQYESTHFGSTRQARMRHCSTTLGTPSQRLCLPSRSQCNSYTKPVSTFKAQK